MPFTASSLEGALKCFFSAQPFIMSCLYRFINDYDKQVHYRKENMNVATILI